MRFAKTIGFMCGWVALLLFFGCASRTVTPAAQSEPAAVQKELPTDIGTHPISVSWELAKNPTVTNGESSLAVHFMVIDGARATIIYSFAGEATLQTEFAGNIRMTDNTGKSYEPVRKTGLLNLDHVHLGSLTFEGLTAEANRLSLVFEPALHTPLVVDVALLDPPNAKINYGAGAQFTMGRSGLFEQSGYGITFNGFFLNQGANTVAQAPAMSEPSPVTTELSNGEPIASEATLRIATLQTGEAEFLYIVILRDGEVRYRILE